MLFNSYEFLFGFLPVTLAGFLLLSQASRQVALGWLTAASLLFYAWWRPVNVLIVAPSILVNFLLARALRRLRETGRAPAAGRAVLAAGIVFNILFLGYFKYTNFLAGVVNDVAGTDLVLARIVLPLGISFITFQKIAFLVDVHAGRVTTFTFGSYLLFVLFFPPLIAGPIVHYRELMPQLDRERKGPRAEDVAVGLTLLALGLFKKVILADGVAPYVTPTYDAAAAGAPIPLVAAWTAALGFTLQIYFDFSGYSDMALGLGRSFGVRLPANFNSPLKATNIIDFWARWHMTLTRFLAAYLYNPVVLWLNRRRLARGRPGIAGRRTSVATFFQILVGPTMLTMGVSGIWHGAGYTFIVWGLLHGVYLCINHAWRLYGPRRGASPRFGWLETTAGFGVTFLAVVVAMVLFRSPTVHVAGTVLSGMAGLSGLGLGSLDLRELAASAGWIAVLLTIALALPNSLEIMRRYDPALDVTPVSRPAPLHVEFPAWRPSLVWGLAVATLLGAVVLGLGPQSEFLYWQF